MSKHNYMFISVPLPCNDAQTVIRIATKTICLEMACPRIETVSSVYEVHETEIGSISYAVFQAKIDCLYLLLLITSAAFRIC